MATDDFKTRLENKRVLALDLQKDGFLDYLHKAVTDAAASAFSNDAVIGATAIPVTATVGQNNEIDVGAAGGPYRAVTGSGYLLKFASDHVLQSIRVPPDPTGGVFSVGLEVALLDDEIEVNPRTGERQYRKQVEAIGRMGTPDLVVDNGDGTLTFRVDAVTEAGKDHTGRSVRVWLKAHSDGGPSDTNKADTTAVAIETRSVVFGSGHNSITTAGNLGQAPVSTTPSDYIIALLGPTVRLKATEDLTSTPGCLFVAEVTSVASGSPITAISTLGQRLVAFDLADLANVLRKDSHGSVKVRVHADASDSDEPQIEVMDSTGSSNLRIVETGELEGIGRAGLYRFLYGSGADGDVVISGTTTLTRHMEFNNLTITGSGVLDPDGWVPLVRNKLLGQAGCKIIGNGSAGGAGGSSTPGAAGVQSTGPLRGGAPSDGDGVVGTALANSLGGKGGNGGAGSVGSAGTASAVSAPTAIYKVPPGCNLGWIMTEAGAAFLRGGGGGAGGGDGGGTAGWGAGGSGADFVLIAAKEIDFTGTIEVKGGNGGAGGNPAAGGGGGGGGGAAMMTCAEPTNITVTVTATGGLGGSAGTGGGAFPGQVGSTGDSTLILVVT